MLLVPLFLAATAFAPPAKVVAVPPRVAQVSKTDTKIGTGKEAKIGDVVEMEYVGTLLVGGKEFDRTKDRAFRFQIGIGQVIAGWDQGIPGMKVGGERTLIIPAALGYGAAGAPPVIPPNADLQFTTKLIQIHPRATWSVIQPGTGAIAAGGDALRFHYRGTLADGKLFDSSYDRKEPIEAEMRGLIPGMNQGLIGMRVGEKRKIVIPPDLAYGASGVPRTDILDGAGKVTTAKGSIIPPDATITFEVELLGVIKRPRS